MRFFDYIKIAFKNLRRQKLRSFLTIIAVVIGATSVVSLLSLVLGASEVLVKQLEKMGAFSTISVMANQVDVSGGGPFGDGGSVEETSDKKLTDDTVKMLKNLSHVVDVVPEVRVWGIESIRMKSGEKSYRMNSLVGQEPNETTAKTLLAGRNFTEDDKKNVIILAPSYLKYLGYENKAEELIGKKVILITHKGYQGEGAVIPEPNASKEAWDSMQEKVTELEVEVIGVVSPGGQDGMSNFIPMTWARGLMMRRWWGEDEDAKEKMERERELLQSQNKWTNNYNQAPPMKLFTEDWVKKNGYSTITVKVDDSSNAEAVAAEIKKQDLGAITAKDFLDQIMRLFTVIGVVLGAIGAIALGVAMIGIINTMIMAIYERTREIGVMRACGATRGTVLGLFTLEAALLGFLGGALGVLCGFGLSYVANYFASGMMSDQGISVDSITAIPWWLVFSVIGFTTFLGFISGLYPAFKASRMNPVEALRYE